MDEISLNFSCFILPAIKTPLHLVILVFKMCLILIDRLYLKKAQVQLILCSQVQLIL